MLLDILTGKTSIFLAGMQRNSAFNHKIDRSWEK